VVATLRPLGSQTKKPEEKERGIIGGSILSPKGVETEAGTFRGTIACQFCARKRKSLGGSYSTVWIQYSRNPGGKKNGTGIENYSGRLQGSGWGQRGKR